MSGSKVGALCAGYLGLELGLRQVIPDAELAWYAEFDKGASKIGAHRWPDVPNHGDMTKIDWAAVEPVDILTGGTPCQDLSHAGKRAGMTEGTRSNLWVAMREAIAQIRPNLVVWENVGGAFSAAADSEVEPCAGCVGDRSGVHLRALGRVVGDLSSLGYVGQVRSLRAADVGAPHGRLRVFVVAQPSGLRRGAGWPAVAGEAAGGWSPADVAGRGDAPLSLLGTPRASEWKGSGPVGSRSHAHMEAREYLSAQVLSLLPTPAVNDMGEGKTVEAWDEWTAKMKAAHGNGNGNGHGASLSIEAQRLLPTPTTQDAAGSRNSTAYRSNGGEGINIGDTLTDFAWKHDGHNDPRMPANEPMQDWGQYAAAIHRWEALTRPAPPPTETGPKGNPRLSAAFSEWMMGLPAGWVTDVPGITRNEALKALGNGVVPQQAAAALREMFAWERVAA